MSFDFSIVGIAGQMSESQIQLRAKYPEHRIKQVKAASRLKELVQKNKHDPVKVLREGRIFKQSKLKC